MARNRYYEDEKTVYKFSGKSVKRRSNSACLTAK